MAKIIINQDKIDNIEEVLQICPFEAMEEVDGKVEINAACKMCKMCVKKGPKGAFIFEDDEVVAINKDEWRGITVYVDHNDGEIHPVTYELIGKARELAAKINHPVNCVFVGNNIKDKCDTLLAYGVDEVFVYDSEEYDKFRIEPYSAALEDYINNNKPSIMLVGGTTLGRSLAPRLAARFKTGLTADCTILDVQENTDLDQIRPAFGGNIMAHINTPNSRPQFATVRYKISNIKVLETKIKNKVVGIEEAEVIVVASRAFKKEEDLKMLNELADALGAQIAGTRPTIECGWVDPKKQIGLSGRTVKPKLIITCGVSGAVQFVAGMKGSDYIIAINQDEKAPIFDVAHLGIIGDIYEIIPKLTEKIKAMKNEDTQKVAQMAK